MAMLHMDFQEGFTGDTVVVHVDGTEVFRQDGLKTKPMLGKAGGFSVDVGEGPAKVEIRIPARRVHKVIELPASHTPYVGVSVVDGDITHLHSETPFGYA